MSNWIYLNFTTRVIIMLSLIEALDLSLEHIIPSQFIFTNRFSVMVPQNGEFSVIRLNGFSLRSQAKALQMICLKVEVRLRPKFSRPVCLGGRHPSGAQDQIFITVIQLRVC
jgi:hypothetical protein